MVNNVLPETSYEEFDARQLHTRKVEKVEDFMPDDGSGKLEVHA